MSHTETNGKMLNTAYRASKALILCIIHCFRKVRLYSWNELLQIFTKHEEIYKHHDKILFLNCSYFFGSVFIPTAIEKDFNVNLHFSHRLINANLHEGSMTFQL